MERNSINILMNLRMISKIQNGMSLNLINKAEPCIYDPTWGNWIMRKLHRDGKINTITWLLNLYIDIKTFSIELIKSINTESDEVIKLDRVLMLKRIAFELFKSNFGLDSLTATYSFYTSTVSRIESIELDIVKPLIDRISLVLPEDQRNDLKQQISKL